MDIPDNQWEASKAEIESLRVVVSAIHEALGEDPASDDETLPEGVRLRLEGCAEIARRLEKAEKERDEAREVLGEVVHQACKVEGAERLDSSALRTYADALRLLASWGQVRITSEAGRRVIAEWVEQ